MALMDAIYVTAPLVFETVADSRAFALVKAALPLPFPSILEPTRARAVPRPHSVVHRSPGCQRRASDHATPRVCGGRRPWDSNDAAVPQFGLAAERNAASPCRKDTSVTPASEVSLPHLPRRNTAHISTARVPPSRLTWHLHRSTPGRSLPSFS